jgi:hypothetical protein
MGNLRTIECQNQNTYDEKAMPTVPTLIEIAYDSIRGPLCAFVIAATTSAKGLAPDIRAVGTGMEYHLASVFGAAVLRA